MPIRIQNDLPAKEILEKEDVYKRQRWKPPILEKRGGGANGYI